MEKKQSDSNTNSFSEYGVIKKIGFYSIIKLRYSDEELYKMVHRNLIRLGYATKRDFTFKTHTYKEKTIYVLEAILLHKDVLLVMRISKIRQAEKALEKAHQLLIAYQNSN